MNRKTKLIARQLFITPLAVALAIAVIFGTTGINTSAETIDTERDEEIVLTEATKAFEDVWVDIIDYSLEYTGLPLVPRIEVYDLNSDNGLLHEGIDYELVCENNIEPGCATVIIVGKGIYTGTQTIQFNILPQLLEESNIELAWPDMTYSGKEKKCSYVVVDDNGKTLKEGTDFIVIYTDNINVGTMGISFETPESGSGRYIVANTFWKKINPKTLSATSVNLKASSFTYKGTAIKPSVTVKDGSKVLVKGTDYTVAYAKNKAVGTATVTIKGKGNYKGTVKKTFKINPKGTSISSLTAASKAFTVKWKKQTTQTTGYQIQYSLKKNFASGNKTVTVSKSSVVKKKIGKLKSKKTYYVRIRTYKTVGGKKYYSGWSAVKSVKTK